MRPFATGILVPVLFGAVAHCWWERDAGAAVAAERALIVSYAGEAEPKDLALVTRVVKALEDRGLVHSEELVREVERTISKDPGDNSGAEAFREAVKQGRQQFIEGNYEAAARALQRAVAGLEGKAALLARQQDLRSPLHEALLFLAHAHLRAGRNRQAAEVISEAVRSFPDHHPALTKYAPDLVSLYRSVRLELRSQRLGSLDIATNVPGCLAFVNGRYVGITPTQVTDLLAGRYRVYVQQPKHRGRVHLVDVAGGTAKVSVDFALDAALATRVQVALRYGNEQSMREHQLDHAVALGRAVGVREVLVVGFQRYNERRSLHGSVISVATGRTLRSGLLAVEPSLPNEAELKALAHFLQSGEQRQGVLIGAQGGIAAGNAHEGFWSARIWRWITLGVGVAAIGVGTSLVILDGKDTCPTDTATCKEVYQTAGPGIGLLVGGGVSLALSTWLFWAAQPSEAPAKPGDAGPKAASRWPRALIAPWVGGHGAGFTAVAHF